MTATPSVQRLHVCTGSGDLFGPLSWGDAEPTHEQRCRDRACPQQHNAWHRPRTTLPEPTGDFPTAVELCYCCVWVVIRGGSRWSSFFCESCRAAVVRLRDTLGFAAIPLGRHSIMNGAALSGRDAEDERLVDAFLMEWQDINTRIDRLRQWQRVVVADHVAAMRCSVPYIPVAEYLAFTAQHAPPQPEMFRQLCRYFDLVPTHASP